MVIAASSIIDSCVGMGIGGIDGIDGGGIIPCMSEDVGGGIMCGGMPTPCGKEGGDHCGKPFGGDGAAEDDAGAAIAGEAADAAAADDDCAEAATLAGAPPLRRAACCCLIIAAICLLPLGVPTVRSLLYAGVPDAVIAASPAKVCRAAATPPLDEPDVEEAGA